MLCGMAPRSLEVVTRLHVTYTHGCMQVNQYRFVAHLGAGAYGEVVLAVNASTGDNVVGVRAVAGYCCAMVSTGGS